MDSTIKIKTHQSEPCIEIGGFCSQKSLDPLLKAFHKTLPRTSKTLYLQFLEDAYLDSASLGIMMFNFRKLQESGKGMSILNASPEIRRLLKTTALDRIFATEPE